MMIQQDSKFLQRPSQRFHAASRAILALAGAAITIFMGSCSDLHLHRSSPYPEPDRLVKVVKTTAATPEAPISSQDFLEWRNQSRTIAPMAVYASRAVSLTAAGGAPERIFCSLVSADFFQALGVRPLLGRAFIAEENQSGKHPVVIISHQLWQRRFGGDPSLIGRVITLDQEAYTVVGVMPADVRFPKDCDLWLPLADHDKENQNLADKSLGVAALGRLKPGVTLEQAQAEMTTIVQGLAKKYPETNNAASIKLTRLFE